MQFTGVTSQNACHCFKQIVWPICGHVWHSPRTLNYKANTGYLSSLTLEMPQAFPSDMATRSFIPHYFPHIVKVKFAPTHLLTTLTVHARRHTSFLGKQMRQQQYAYYFLKPVRSRGDFGKYFRH